MFTQSDIDSVLISAQSAVDDLARQADALSGEATLPDQAAGRAPASAAAYASTPNIQRILKLRVPVYVRLAERTMRTSDIMKLAPGTIIEFERMVTDELDLMVNNCQIGTGEAVKVGEHFGLRVKYIGDVGERIALLGGG